VRKDATAKPAGEPVRTPREILNDPEVKLALQQDFQQLLGRLNYKPDPYAEGPGCVSEARPTLRNELLLTVRMQLTRAEGQRIELGRADYFVSDTRVKERSSATTAPGTPRLELVHADGHSDTSDFVGVYGEGDHERSTREAPAPDLTLVKVWLASAPMDASVVAHRIVLDGRVLREIKRPEVAPELSPIRCDEQKGGGVKLSWNTQTPGPSAPLLVDVLRHGPLGFVEELPFADARKVSGFTIAQKSAASDDTVLLVSVTDTFQLVTRGVLVPKQSL
jgi:hypothetical protein